MAKISKLEPSKHIGGRFLVFLEGADPPLLKVTEDEVLHFALFVGKELDEATLTALTQAANRSNAKATAARIIGARPLSKGELVRRLIEKGYDGACAQSSADWLEDIGAINDQDYANMLARHYAARGYGTRKIQDEFYKRKVPRDCWPQALEELDGFDHTIDRLIEKKLRDKAPDRKELSRVSAFLARRGFSWTEIREGLERYSATWEEC